MPLDWRWPPKHEIVQRKQEISDQYMMLKRKTGCGKFYIKIEENDRNEQVSHTNTNLKKYDTSQYNWTSN